MNKSQELIQLVEGGLVKVPNALRKKIQTIVKSAFVGYLFDTQKSILKTLDTTIEYDKTTKDNVKYAKELKKEFEEFMKRVNRQAELNQKYVKTFGKKSTIKVKLEPDDFKPYTLREPYQDGFVLPVKVSMNSRKSPDLKKGTHGSISYKYNRKTNEINRESIAFTVDISQLADIVTQFKKGLGWLVSLPHRDINAKQQESMKGLFNVLKKSYESNLSSMISTSTHELTHLIQAMTGVGMKGEFFDQQKLANKKKGSRTYGTDYYASEVEYKPQLSSAVNSFYDIVRDLSSEYPAKDVFRAALDTFVESSKFLNSIKAKHGDKAKQKAVRDLVTAIQKDRRYKSMKPSKAGKFLGDLK